MGLQLEGGPLVFYAKSGYRGSSERLGTVASPATGLYAFLDITLDADEIFRVGVVVDYVALERLVHPFLRFTPVFTGGGSVGARALFGADLVEHLIFRSGVEFAAVVPDGPIGWSAIGRFELGWRGLPERTLEVGISAFGGIRSGAVAEFCEDGLCPARGSLAIVAVGVSLQVGWVFT